MSSTTPTHAPKCHCVQCHRDHNARTGYCYRCHRCTACCPCGVPRRLVDDVARTAQRSRDGHPMRAL